MSKKIHEEVDKLTKELSSGKIEISEAVEKFVIILSGFESSHDLDENTLLFDTKSIIINKLKEINKEQDKHIQKLYRAIILQEIGVVFKKEELDTLFSQRIVPPQSFYFD